MLATGVAPAEAAYYNASVPETSFRYSPGSGSLSGNRVVLWSTGAATAFVDLTEPTVRFQLDVIAEQCAGLPRLEVAIDDVTLLGREVAGTGTYGIPGSWAPGRHKVTLRFKNDFVSPTCDRNLRLGRFIFQGRMPGGFIPPVGTEQRLVPSYATIDPPGAGSISVMPDAEYYGPVPILQTNGSAKFQLDSQGAYQLWLSLRPIACEGNPSYRVRIDGQVVTEAVVPVPVEGPSAVIRIDGTWPNGLHNVEVAMFNDRETAACDRSLAVESFYFRGRV
jgi:hypothetical protein